MAEVYALRYWRSAESTTDSYGTEHMNHLLKKFRFSRSRRI